LTINKNIFVCMCIIANPMRFVSLGRGWSRGRGVGRGQDCPTPLSPQSGVRGVTGRGQDHPARPSPLHHRQPLSLSSTQERAGKPLLPPRQQPFVRDSWMRRGFRRFPPSAAAPAATESATTSPTIAGLQLLLRRASNRIREVDAMLMRGVEILAEIDEQQQQKTDDE